MTLRVLDEARQDADEAVAFYDQHRHALGDEFLEELARLFGEIRDHPERHPRVEIPRLKSNYRDALMGRFPFRVIFSIDPGEIVVHAVAHTSRRPGYWRNRRP